MGTRIEVEPAERRRTSRWPCGCEAFHPVDCFHDMADPAGAAKHVRAKLKPGGSWMLVEPFAKDKPEENHNPIGKLFYSASTMICVGVSLAQKGPALGAQAGEAKIREIVTKAGFTRFRRATETPFNLVFEARP